MGDPNLELTFLAFRYLFNMGLVKQVPKRDIFEKISDFVTKFSP